MLPEHRGHLLRDPVDVRNVMARTELPHNAANRVPLSTGHATRREVVSDGRLQSRQTQRGGAYHANHDVGLFAGVQSHGNVQKYAIVRCRGERGRVPRSCWWRRGWVRGVATPRCATTTARRGRRPPYTTTAAGSPAATAHSAASTTPAATATTAGASTTALTRCMVGRALAVWDGRGQVLLPETSMLRCRPWGD